MVESKIKYILSSAKSKELMKEFDISQAMVSRVLNLDLNSKFAKFILKRAIEKGAKKQTITIETED